MLKIFNQNYKRIINKLPLELNGNFTKIGLNFFIFIYWMIIVLGTFIMLS